MMGAITSKLDALDVVETDVVSEILPSGWFEEIRAKMPSK